MSRVIKITVDDHQYERLTSTAKRTGAPVAHQVRKAIDAYLDGQDDHAQIQTGQMTINEGRDAHGYPPLAADIKLPDAPDIVAWGRDTQELIRQLQDGLKKLSSLKPQE